jgi:hypothetical protein
MLRPPVLLASLAAALSLVFAPSAPAEAPHFYSPPYILGPNPPTVGSILTGENGGVVCAPGCFKQTFQWFHCTANSNVSNCVPVSDVTEEQEYVVQAGDVGWSLVVQVTPWNHDCNEKLTECRDSHTSRNSAPTAPVLGAVGGGAPPPPPPAPVIVAPAKFFPATPGIYYSVELTGSGGAAPYACALGGGMLPYGLTLSGCTVSGLPQATPGVFTFTVNVTDKNGQKGAKTYAMIVATPVILATPMGLSAAFVGQFYTAQFGATGGTEPYTFSVSDGALPAGLTLADTGLLSGTPTSAGTGLFTVTMRDSFGSTGTQTYRLVVDKPAATIKKKPGVTKKKAAPKRKRATKRR